MSLNSAAPLSFTAPELARELPAALALGAIFLSLFAAAEVLRRVSSWPAEATRKFVHVGAGVAVLVVPVWFTSQLTVVGLTAAFFLVLALTKVRGVLQSVHGVERRSSGALLYPVALGLLALLSGGRAVLFEAPLLVLAFADAAAAMVGVRYGRRVYTVNGCVRTVEGSAAFAATAFVVVAAVMGVHGAALLHSLAVALVVAPALTVVEAIATRGLDNLALPLAGFFVLSLALPAPPALLFLLAVASALLVLTALLAQALWLSPAPQSSPDGAE